jgi:shikimate dehydrogenase
MDKYALIGKHLSHSFSSKFFNEKFQLEQLNCTYQNIEIETIDEIIPILSSKIFKGLNVTIPYKESILNYLDDIEPTAIKIGAVNTINLENNKYVGYNTDAFGFKQSIKPFLTNKHEKALILGTGGAAKAITHVLKEIGIAVFFLSRNPKNENEFCYSQVNDLMIQNFKLIINCTPLGTYPNINEILPIPIEMVTNEHLVVDLIYNPNKTQLLSIAENKGATILNGLSMLKEQALKSWDIWNT